MATEFIKSIESFSNEKYDKNFHNILHESPKKCKNYKEHNIESNIYKITEICVRKKFRNMDEENIKININNWISQTNKDCIKKLEKRIDFSDDTRQHLKDINRKNGGLKCSKCINRTYKELDVAHIINASVNNESNRSISTIIRNTDSIHSPLSWYEMISSNSNGLVLCKKCHEEVDKKGENKYTFTKLFKYKLKSEKNIEKTEEDNEKKIKEMMKMNYRLMEINIKLISLIVRKKI